MDEVNKVLTLLDEIDQRIKEINQTLYKQQRDYCEIGMSRCSCGWVGRYPMSGCPNCQKTFVD